MKSMLVLTRRAGEAIIIGDLLEIRLLGVSESRVQLAIRSLKADIPLLKLTLSTDQCVEIGDQIVVKAVRRAGEHSRIGITAPPDMPIVRGEKRPFN
ncbi:MAG: carbon storage regulator [Planctomycetes bacterium]|nr:carbon storage regulator [Planctomycetota bacterium]